MKRFISIFLFLGFLNSFNSYAQENNKNMMNVKWDKDTKVVYCSDFNITKPLTEIVKEHSFLERNTPLMEYPDKEGRPIQTFEYSAEKDGTAYTCEPKIIQTSFGNKNTNVNKAPIQNWEGQVASGFRPFDPTGAVGPNHYIQMINSTTYRIYTKTGSTILTGTLGDLWSPSTGNAGDPIVLYDKDADRWFMSQFSDGSGPDGNDIYIAISQTSDPTSSWYTYTFTSPDFPDYLKFSAWQDGYYMTANFAQKIFAFNRSKMLAGDASAEALYQSFSPPQSGFFVPLPADASDGIMPGAGTPCPVFSYSDNGWGGGNIDAVNIYSATVDWGALTMNVSSTATLPTNAFDASYDPGWDDIPQPGTSQYLDGIGGAMMFRAQWKPWTGYNTTVLSWAVRISASQRGIFWCELRQDQTTENWSIYQQGIYAPDTDYYWMSSAAMNDLGDIALCYAKGSSSTYMSLAYTGRNAGDPLGLMTFSEEIAFLGSGIQTWTNRVGDYAHTCLDVDGVTFWHTGEYMGSGNDNPRTRIYSFQLPSATSPPVANFLADNLFPVPGQTVQFTDLSTNTPTSWTWSFSPSTITYQGGTDANTQNPQVSFDVAGYYTVTLTATNAYGSDAETKVDYIYAGPCSEPSNLNATAITNTSAQLSWTAGGGETQWNIEYGLQGFTQGTGTVINGVSNPYTLTGLTDSTSYDFYVQADCGDGYTSSWIGPFTFTTTDCSYCTASGGGNDEYIDDVQLNDINNTGTGYSDYSDFTNISTDLYIGQTYDLDIILGLGYTIDDIGVWIDWNQDCDFDDTGEDVVCQVGLVFLNNTFSITVPPTANIGSTRMRIRLKYYGNNCGNPCGTTTYGEVEDYTVNIKLCDPSNTTTWNGSNWIDGTPDEYTTAIINGNYTATTNFTCCSMIVNPGNTITIPAGEYIEIMDNLDMNGTLEVENEGSLVQWNDEAANSGAGTYLIHKTTPEYADYDYIFWSSPVDSETIGSVFNANHPNYIWSLDTGNFLDLYSGYGHPQTTGSPDTFDDNADDWQHMGSGDTLTPGVGYIAMGEGSDFPLDFTNIETDNTQSVVFDGGTINNGAIQVSVEQDEYNATGMSGADSFHTNANLIGNPYPSAIDISLFKMANPLLEGTFYFWMHDTNISSGGGPWVYNFTNDDYSTVAVDGAGVVSITAAGNGGGGSSASRYVASGQGFFANVTGNGTLTFNNSMRVTGPNDTFRSTNTNIDKFWLNLSQENSTEVRQIYIGFHNQASDDYQAGQDAQRMENGNNLDFYSIIPGDERHFAIQNLAAYDENKIVPLGVESREVGNYTINMVKGEGIFNSQAIYLFDHKLNLLHELSAMPYDFVITDLELGELVDRFEIHFIDTNTVGVNETILAELNIYPNPSSDLFYFNWNSFEKLQIEVYNSQGQHLKTEWMEAGDALDMKEYAAGIYYTVISFGEQQVQRKLVVH